MKIEICDNTSKVLVTLAIGLLIGSVAYQIRAYNSLAYEKGYSAVQMHGSQQVMWVKGKE